MNNIPINNRRDLIDLLSRNWASFFLVYEGIPDKRYRQAIGELTADEGYYEICIDGIPESSRGFLLNRPLFEFSGESPTKTLPYLGGFVRYFGHIIFCENLEGVNRVVSKTRHEKSEAMSFYKNRK